MPEKFGEFEQLYEEARYCGCVSEGCGYEALCSRLCVWLSMSRLCKSMLYSSSKTMYMNAGYMKAVYMNAVRVKAVCRPCV